LFWKFQYYLVFQPILQKGHQNKSAIYYAYFSNLLTNYYKIALKNVENKIDNMSNYF